MVVTVCRMSSFHWRWRRSNRLSWSTASILPSCLFTDTTPRGTRHCQCMLYLARLYRGPAPALVAARIWCFFPDPAEIRLRRKFYPEADAFCRIWKMHKSNANSIFCKKIQLTFRLKTILLRSSIPDAIWQCTVLYLHARRSVLICHHVLAAANWFCWHCTMVLQQQCDNTT